MVAQNPMRTKKTWFLLGESLRKSHLCESSSDIMNMEEGTSYTTSTVHFSKVNNNNNNNNNNSYSLSFDGAFWV